MTARGFNMTRHRAIISRHVMTSRPDQNTQIEGRVRLAGKNVEDTRKVSETGAHIRCYPEMQQEETGTLKVQGFAAALPFIVRGKNSDRLHVELQLPEPLSVSYRQWLNDRVNSDLARVSW